MMSTLFSSASFAMICCIFWEALPRMSLAVFLEIRLQIVGDALGIALLALTLQLQIGGSLLVEFTAGQLLLDRLQIRLQLG